MSATVDWIVPQVEDLDDYLAGRAMTALRERALASGQDDPFENVMNDVTNRIRDEIRGCKSNRISETQNAIPPGLKKAACLMIIEAMQGRLPGVDLTEKQAAMLSDERDYLKRISRCEVPITTPTDPEPESTVQTPYPGVVVTYSTRLTGRTNMRGL